MARIIVKGIPPYDGDYELDADIAFNTREWRWIKQVSGYMPLTVAEGFEGGDPSLFVSLAVIAMARAGKVDRARGIEVADELAEAPFDGASITMVGDPVEEADELPLDLTPPPAAPSPPASSSNEDSRKGNESLSGNDLKTGSAPLGVTPSVTSLLRSGTS